MDIDGQVCFYRRPFSIPFRPLRFTTGSLGPVNGINKDVSGKAVADGPVGQLLAGPLFLKVKTKFHFTKSK